MPIYEYRCDKCEREFEVEQRIVEAPLKSCPECRSRRVKRLISQTSFVLKGSGWYSDLYSSKGKDAKPDAPVDDSKGDGKSADKKEKKSAEKSDGKSGGQVDPSPKGGKSPKAKAAA